MRNRLTILLAAAIPLAMALLMGCGQRNRVKLTGEKKAAPLSDELFANAVDSLNRLEEADLSDLNQQITHITVCLRQTQRLPDSVQNDRLAAGWPEPETIRQAVSRLNQWAQAQTPPDDWRPDPLLATLPDNVNALPLMRNLGRMELSYYDGLTLQEAFWLRDLSGWARGGQADGLEWAKNLFDWTVRNIALVPDSSDRLPLLPWEVLLLGRGTAWERAWVFTLLCRQQKIDAAILTLPTDRPWCVGVVIENGRGEKDLYLFDPALGLPIPAPGGVRLRGGGQLEVQPATLRQVIADPALMGRLDYDETRAPYWPRRSELKQVTALVEASPLYLSNRARLIESRLAAPHSAVLTADATGQAQRLKSVAGVADSGIWKRPYQTFERRWRATAPEMLKHLLQLMPFVLCWERGPNLRVDCPMYKGRIAMLKGEWMGQGQAIEHFQEARPSNSQLQGVPSGDQPLYFFAKINSSFWLGLIAFEQGQRATEETAGMRHYDSAVDYLSHRTLKAVPRDLEATSMGAAAHYNLGRTYEAMGQRDQAVVEYQAVLPSSEMHHGALLRARWLRELAAAPPAKGAGADAARSAGKDPEPPTPAVPTKK